MIVNPLTGDRGETLRALCDNKFIDNPKQHFNVSVCADTKSKVEKQVTKQINLVQKALILNEYELAKYKLKELVDLVEILKMPWVEELIRNQIPSVVDAMSKCYETHTAFFLRKIEQKELLNEKDLVDYVKCLENARASSSELSKFAQSVRDSTRFNKYELLKELGKLEKTLLEEKVWRR